MNITRDFLNINPYSLKKKYKLKKFLYYINKLTEIGRASCRERV